MPFFVSSVLMENTNHYANKPIDIMVRVFANGPGDKGFNPRLSHTKDSKHST